jgi:hypothetical protein
VYWGVAAFIAGLTILFIVIEHVESDDDGTDVEARFRRNTRIVIASLLLVGSVVWPLLGLACLGLLAREFFGVVRTAWRETDRR